MYKIYSTKKIAAGRSRRQNGGYGTRDSQKKSRRAFFSVRMRKTGRLLLGTASFFVSLSDETFFLSEYAQWNTTSKNLK